MLGASVVVAAVVDGAAVVAGASELLLLSVPESPQAAAKTPRASRSAKTRPMVLLDIEPSWMEHG